MQTVVRNLHTRDLDLCDSGELAVDPGDAVVYRSRYGLDIGLALGSGSRDHMESFERALTIERRATERDIAEHEARIEDEDRLRRRAARLVDDLGLDMRIISTHYLIDGSKLLVFFSAEHRVDFRQLVRDLAGEVKARVELRQIGVRDGTRINGGIGICGRRLCCNSFSDSLGSVSIRMAKDQNYSLNSMKVSGHCGRLLCCLAYEHSFYREERRHYPKEGSWVTVEDERYRVHELSLLTGEVRLSGQGGEHMVVPHCALERIDTAGARRSEAQWRVNRERCPKLRTEADRA